MSQGFYLRSAAPEDAKVLFELSNEDSVRRQSIVSEPIAWEKHLEWFRSRLADPDHSFFIVNAPSGAFLGQVRYSIRQAAATVSISLHPCCRGKGLSVPVLLAADRKLFLSRQDVREVIAYIRPDNLAAIKAFERAGYVAVGSETIKGVLLSRSVLRRKGFAIGDRWIGPDSPAYIVAELSANHNGSFETALATVRAMKDAGADAVKLQTYTPDTITLDAPQEHFKIKQGTLWDGRTLHDLYAEAMTPWDWQPKLKEEAERLGMACFSSPFDPGAVDFLERMNVPAYKIASFEITDTPLISLAAAKGKPVMISTGVAEYADIVEAVAACRRAGNEQLALLKCTSAYPAPVDEANLLTIPDLAEEFNVVVGLSDHTLGHSLAVAAVVMGARIVEKHFILDRNAGGPDSAFSLEPAEFKALVSAVREAEAALGGVTYGVTPKASANRAFARSLFVVKDIKKGEAFTPENVRSIRPGVGMPPRSLPEVLGRKAATDIARGTPMSRELLAD